MLRVVRLGFGSRQGPTHLLSNGYRG